MSISFYALISLVRASICAMASQSTCSLDFLFQFRYGHIKSQAKCRLRGTKCDHNIETSKSPSLWGCLVEHCSVNKRYNLLCTSNNMVLSSLIYIAMVIIVIIVIIILLRFLFGVLFVIPSTITDPANMLLLPRDAFLHPNQLLGFS